MATPQTVIVTGGAQGIGLGIARCFARRNANLIIADRAVEKAREAADQLRAAGAMDAAALACDITDRGQVDAMVEQTVKRFGGMDVLVNNAGICPFIEIMELSPEVWQKTIDVNLTGAFHCTQAVARRMIPRGRGGRIIFITSGADTLTSPKQVDYAAAKSGLRMAMVGFSTALGKYGITCNAIAPGMILTPMTAFHWEIPENAALLKQRVPMGRIGTPEDIGNAAVFLASAEASYINGITLRVDGGLWGITPI